MDETAVLLEQHIPALRRYAFALVRQHDAADDLVQDCLERAIGRWHLRRRDGDLKAWLLTILRNQFINTYRQKRRRWFHFAWEDVTEPPTSDGAPDSSTAVRDNLAGLEMLGGVGQLVLSHNMVRSLGPLQENLAIIRQHYDGPTKVAEDLICFD